MKDPMRKRKPPQAPKVTAWDWLAVTILMVALGIGAWYFLIYLPTFMC
jgi:hypothetical protein